MKEGAVIGNHVLHKGRALIDKLLPVFYDQLKVCIHKEDVGHPVVLRRREGSHQTLVAIPHEIDPFVPVQCSS